MNEAETRAELIDPALKAAGWGVVESSRVRREVITLGRLQGGGVRAAQDIADYVLTYRNHKLAVIRPSGGPARYRRPRPGQEIREKLQIRSAYFINGAGIHQVDMTDGAEQDVAAISDPDELWNRVSAERMSGRPLRRHSVRGQGRLLQARDHQDIAIRPREAIAAGQDRIR